jgi:RTX calcium-binding nonapeptide repeat (4 copies)
VPVRPRLALPFALAALLLPAAPAVAGGFVHVDGPVLRFDGDDLEASNVTIDDAGGMLVLDENASRMTAGPGCTASPDGYHVACADTGVERIDVQLGFLGSDVRIRAALPSVVRGGPGDDLIVGGPAEDTIDGGPGADVLAGGSGADVLSGGPGEDLVTYEDRIAADGTLLPRRGAVRAQIGRLDWSGSGDERDTIESDVEQVQGGAGNDRFSLRDGRATDVACGGGRDTVEADARDTIELDCESASVAPQRGGPRMVVPTLPFPFPSVNDRARDTIGVEPTLPLHGDAIALRVSCPAGLGLLALVRADPCTGRVRFARSGGTAMGTQRVKVPRGGAISLRLPLHDSRALARRAAGLTVLATALPDRGHVVRTLRFRVRG